MKYKLLPLNLLKPHEKTAKRALAKLKARLLAEGFLINPVIIENKHFIILDGHHRVQALKDLGFKNIPVHLVNYSDKNIKVNPRRKEIKISKDIIIQEVLNQKLFPYKTSKHTIPHRLMRINLDLNKLR
jgi:hypothetical protein